MKEYQSWLIEALGSAGVGAWTMNIKSGVVEYTPACQDIFGTAPQQTPFLYTDFLELVHLDDRHRVQEAIRRCIEEGVPYAEEYRVPQSDGTIRWIEARGNIQRDSSGQPMVFLGTLADVSRRRVEQNRLEEIALAVSSKTGEDFFGTLSSHLRELLKGDFVSIGRLRQDSREAVEVIAYDSSNPDEKDCWQEYRVCGTPCRMILQQGIKVFCSGLQIEFPEDSFLKQRGFQAYAGVPLKGSDGTILGLISVFWRAPIREEKVQSLATLQIFAARASAELEFWVRQAAIRQCNQTLAQISRSVFDEKQQMSLQDIVVAATNSLGGCQGCLTIVDEKQKATRHWAVPLEQGQRASQRRSEICWFSSTTDLGPTIYTDLNRDSKDPGVALLRSLGGRTALEAPIRRGTELLGALTLWSKAGARAWREHEVGFMSSLSDLIVLVLETEKRRTLEASAAHLEAQLLQAQKMEGIGRLAGGVAHDFNNLLTVILSSASILEEELEDNSSAQEDARLLMEAAEQAAEVTGQLLAFARKQSGKAQSISLDKVILKTKRLLDRLLGESVELKAHVAEENYLVSADPVQVEQILVNLAVNAKDAMPGGGLLAIELCQCSLNEAEATGFSLSPGNYARLRVADSGTGISPDVLPHIFDPFFTTKDPGRGTGLGLATCFGIVRAAGGSISVSTQEGEGTRFDIYLPLVGGVASENKMRVANDSLEPIRGKVAVVEDDPRVRRLVARALTAVGYDVEVYESAHEALACPKKGLHECDLLLTDVWLPGMTGIELARQLKENYPRLPVVYMSGQPAESTLMRPPRAGEAYLRKPFTPGQLAKQIGELIH